MQSISGSSIFALWSKNGLPTPGYRRWYDYSKARDLMLEATDSGHDPWHIVRSDNKRRGRLNCIAHILSLIPYEDAPHPKIKLPKRSSKGRYDDEAALKGRNFIPERY